MRLPRLKVGDCLHASRRVNAVNVPLGVITIVSIGASSFFCRWPDGSPVGVSRRALRQYGGVAFGDGLIEFSIYPPGSVPLASIVAETVTGHRGPVVVHGGLQ